MYIANRRLRPFSSPRVGAPPAATAPRGRTRTVSIAAVVIALVVALAVALVVAFTTFGASKCIATGSEGCEERKNLYAKDASSARR